MFCREREIDKRAVAYYEATALFYELQLILSTLYILFTALVFRGIYLVRIVFT